MYRETIWEVNMEDACERQPLKSRGRRETLRTSATEDRKNVPHLILHFLKTISQLQVSMASSLAQHNSLNLTHKTKSNLEN